MKGSTKRHFFMVLTCILFTSLAIGCGNGNENEINTAESSNVEKVSPVEDVIAEQSESNITEDSISLSKDIKDPTYSDNQNFAESRIEEKSGDLVDSSEQKIEAESKTVFPQEGTNETIAINSSKTDQSGAETEETEADKSEDDFTKEPLVPVEVTPSTPETTSASDEASEDVFTEDDYYTEDAGLSSTQRNSINMLNYMTVLTQEINEAKGNQLFLESAYSSLVNDIFPNAVDTKTQAQITSLMDTVDGYRMIAVKRDRLEYIYEQNRAQALRQAIPNPVALLSAVQSGSLLKAAASVLYMAVDSVASYNSATSQADLQFIKDGWELDDAESAELHNSTKNALNYMLNMVRDYDLPGDYALSAEDVENFVSWSGKPDSQLVGKIAWLESHQGTFQEFGPYWLEMAKDYYNSDEYGKCLGAIKKYESVSTRIFRKDIDYATALPMAIISAKETMPRADYIEIAEQYCDVILKNIKDADWSLRYFTAQIQLDLYNMTKDDSHLEKAYKAAFDNIVVLVEEQKNLNTAYLADVKEVKADKDATKREKKEIKEYNKLLKEERKITLPPVSEALYLNCDLLFALAEKMNLSTEKKNQVDSILHESGENIFLTQALDDRFWFNKKTDSIDVDEIETTFDGKKMTLPATCVTDRSIITVTVTGHNGSKTFDDWTVTNVKRPKKASCSEYIVYLESEEGKSYNYQAGETVTIRVSPVAETPEKYFEFTYNAIEVKVAFVFKGIDFERVVK